MRSEFGITDRLSGMGRKSFWPTLNGLLQMLDDTGFGNCEVIWREPRNPDGQAVLLTCESTKAGPPDFGTASHLPAASNGPVLCANRCER
jgi:hypothetical protein